MAHAHLTRRLDRTEEAITALFCLVDDAYHNLNPDRSRYGSLKKLSDSEVVTLALFQKNFGAPRANAPSCATRRGSSLTCSPG